MGLIFCLKIHYIKVDFRKNFWARRAQNLANLFQVSEPELRVGPLNPENFSHLFPVGARSAPPEGSGSLSGEAPSQLPIRIRGSIGSVVVGPVGP